MLKVDALLYFSLGERVADARWLFTFEEARLGGPDEGSGLYDAEKNEIIDDLKKMYEVCKETGLTTSLFLFECLLYDPPQTKRELAILVDAVRAELKSKLFLFVPPHRAKYYEMILQSIVTTAFPLASKELINAGNCLAAGFFTACVFHSMRAAEIGVRVLGKELGVSFPDKPIELAEWQPILNQVESKIGNMQKLPRGAPKDEELHFYSDAAKQFRYFKDKWRVRCAHARESYEESPATKALTHTIEFFETLATRLKEPEPSV
ncbi:MAG: hypothetical protein WA624_17390 [Methylocella sp.]